MQAQAHPGGQLQGLKSLDDGSAETSASSVEPLAEVGRGALVNPDKVFYAASLYKLSVLYEVFHQRALGLLDFDEEMLVTPYYADFDLGTLPGRDGSIALCINDFGQVVGYSYYTLGNSHATLFDTNDSANNIDLGTLPSGSSSWAYSINNAGQIVG